MRLQKRMQPFCFLHSRDSAIIERQERQMAREQKKLKSILIGTLLLATIPLAGRAAFLCLGPPILNPSADPKQEAQRLWEELRQDLGEYNKRRLLFNRTAISRIPPVSAAFEYFFSCNSRKYAECFLEIAEHHLSDRQLASTALAKAIRQDQGWTGERAVGLYAAHFADSENTIDVCEDLENYDRKFAINQLSRMKNEAQHPAMKACILASMGKLLRAADNDESAREYIQKALILFDRFEARGRLLKLKEEAQNTLAEMSRLSDKEPAPEIEGVLQNGISARLSDYRKKVIFLDFWGDW